MEVCLLVWLFSSVFCEAYSAPILILSNMLLYEIHHVSESANRHAGAKKNRRRGEMIEAATGSAGFDAER